MKVIILILSITILSDQITKYLVHSRMLLGQSFEFIPFILNITYVTNTGAAFGILQNHRWVFMSSTTLAIIGMIFALRYLHKRKQFPFMRIAIAFMLGGGIGNMFDRVTKGYVIDFMDLAFVNFAIFNLADMYIIFGAISFCVYIITNAREIDAVFEKRPKLCEERADNRDDEIS